MLARACWTSPCRPPLVVAGDGTDYRLARYIIAPYLRSYATKSLDSDPTTVTAAVPRLAVRKAPQARPKSEWDHLFPRYNIDDSSWDVEDIEGYRPWGWFPLRVGDRVGGRFTLLHKVGHDVTGTRWIARHQQVLSPYPGHIAEIKAFSAAATKHARAARELQATKTLQGSRRPSARLPPDDPLYHIQIPYENFEEKPKRMDDLHAFHVYASFGPRVTDIARYSSVDGVEGRLDTSVSRKVIKDVTSAVATMHEHAIIHGDIRPANIRLRALPDVVKKGLGKPVTQPTRITDEHRIGPWAPQEVTKPAVIPAASDVQAFLSNLSCTHIISSNEAEHPGDQAPEYAAPEWLLGSSLSTTVDVWALACTIFELRTGVGLFDHAFHDALSEMDRFIVVDIHTSPPPKLGPIRSWLAELVGFSVADTLKKLNEDKFDPALVTYIGHRLDAAEKGDAGGSDEQFAMFMEQLKIKDEGDVMPHLKAKGMRLPKAPNLAKYEGPLLAVNPTAQMSPEERVLFEDLMCKMLRHDPDERIDMPQVLVHGWFGYQ